MNNPNKLELRKWFVQNPNALSDEKTLRSILSDAYQNDITKVNLLLIAYKKGIVSSLRQSFPWKQSERSRFIKLLEQEHSIVSDRAIWAVDNWSSLFSNRVIDALDQYTSSQNKNATSSHGDNFDVLYRRSEYDIYVDPELEERPDRIFIPCGIGNTDSGFFIYGIRKSKTCDHPAANVYALVYNLLIRSSTITKKNYPQFIKNIDSVYDLDYRSIFRIAISILQMIKNNYAIGENLNLAFSGDNDDLNYAVSLINHYAKLFARLIRINEVTLSVRNCDSGHKFCFKGTSGIHIKENTKLITNAREIWYGKMINYHLREDSLPDLEYLLREISPFDHFLEGQFEALRDMVSAKAHMVCIMPTGSGKSLVYYMISLLQPSPIVIISPTDILIRDQIRNLKQIHQIDNVAHLHLSSESNYVLFDFHNSLNYITPSTLQTRNLVWNFRHLNNNHSSLTNIILDEVHCISNWGHDFRPEYLRLSRFLNEELDTIILLGFTATANYTVVEDVQKQLNIPEENFLSPITFDRNNISYHYRRLDSSEEMLIEIGSICQQMIDKRERTIIFTKSDEISRRVANIVGFEADIFAASDPEAYHHFADGKCLILVTSEDLGIGINFPNIKNIIHFGLPLSKSEYVQQLGRAGRANEQIVSYILYLNSENGTIPAELLSRDTLVEKIPKLLVGFDNDYADIYRKLTNNCPAKEFLINQLLTLRNEFSSKGSRFVETYTDDELNSVKHKLYMLYTTGYIYDYYVHRKTPSGEANEVIIHIKSSNDESQAVKLNRMRKRISDYFEEMGGNRQGIFNVKFANSEEEIIEIYIEWYFNKYLYHNNEQFLDLYEFVISNTHILEWEEITTSIREYFHLPFITLKSDETRYKSMTINQIGNKVLAGLNKNTISNIERINSNNYSYKLDYFLFCANIKYGNGFETDRLQRIFGSVSDQEKKDIVTTIGKFYRISNLEGKLSIIIYFEKYGYQHGITYPKFLDMLYDDGTKDIIYYGILAVKINQVLA